MQAAVDSSDDAKRRRLAITAIAAEIGATVIARGVAKSDPALSDELLETVRAELVKLEGRASPRAHQADGVS